MLCFDNTDVVFVKVFVVLQEYIGVFQELFVEFADIDYRS